jgi:hypothetical protein
MKRKFTPLFVMLFVFTLVFSYLNITPALAGPGASWLYKRTITLNSATPTNNYQIRIQLTDLSNMAANGNDLRFYDPADVQADYWIEAWNTTPVGQATVWVEVPSAATTSLTMYYGNGSATAASNGDTTFLFFDDFSNPATTATKWSSIGSVSISGGSATIGAGQQLIANNSFAMSTGVILESVLSSDVTFAAGSRASLNGASNLSGNGTFFTADEPVNSRFAVWSHGRDFQYGIHTIHEGDGVDNGSNSSQYIQVYNPGGPGTWFSNGYVLGTAFEMNATYPAGRLEYFLSTSITSNPVSQGNSTANVPTVTMYPLLNVNTNNFFSITTFRERRFVTGYGLITGTAGLQAEAVPPTVNTFTATSPTNSLNIPITAFTATDNVAVTGYLITTSATPPLPGAAGWTGTAPGTYTVGSSGTYTLYPWAKDAAGNVSAVFATPRTVVVDTSAPTVNTFTATSPTSNVNIPITAFTASDNVAVTGYLITESSTPPAVGAAGWTGTAPGTYTVGGTGTYTLYPWAKDAAGNVSAVFATPRTVVVAQVIAPGAAGGNGPGGVGYTGINTGLALWLRPDRGVYVNSACNTPAVNGNAVGCWADQSGNSANVTQVTAASQPLYVTNVLNGQPTVKLDGGNDYFNVPFSVIEGRTAFSFFTAFRWNAAGNWARLWDFGQSTNVNGFVTVNSGGNIPRFAITTAGGGGEQRLTFSTALPTGSGQILDVIWGPPNGTGWRNGASQASGAGYTLTPNSLGVLSQNYIGRSIYVGDAYLNADMGEFIVFSTALNDTDRILVENYLQAKYNDSAVNNLTITNDVYNGDTTANGNFDLDMAGIGRFGGNNHTQAFSAGMIVVNRTFLQDNGDWLTFGHLTPTSGYTNADVPTSGAWATAPKPMRWARHWDFNRTDAAGTTGGLVDIIFDFSEGNMNNAGENPAGPVSNYRLLKRANPTGQFTDIATASAIVGDQVQFLGVDVTLLGSNFTLGTLDDNTSPTAVELGSLSARGALVSPWLLFAAAGVLLGLAGAFITLRKR